MLGLLTKDKPLVRGNDDPRVLTAREKTRAAMAEVDRQEADEQRLRDVLNPQADSATTNLREITLEMIHESNTRLIGRKFGVTDPRYADTAEGTAARQVLKAAKAEEAQIRDAVRKELEQQVRERVGDLAKDFQAAFQPCQKLANELRALGEESGVTVPQIH